MVYCTLCGFENDDDAEFCVKCGTPLDSSQAKKGSDKESGYSDLTPVNFITGIIIGVALIILGAGIAFFFHDTGVQRYYGSLLLIILGLLILAGSIYKKIRKKN